MLDFIAQEVLPHLTLVQAYLNVQLVNTVLQVQLLELNVLMVLNQQQWEHQLALHVLQEFIVKDLIKKTVL